MAIVRDISSTTEGTLRFVHVSDLDQKDQNCSSSLKTSDLVLGNEFDSRQCTTDSLTTDEERRARVIEAVAMAVSDFEERASLMVADKIGGRFEAVSPSFAAMIGCRSDEIVGKSSRWFSIGLSDDAELHRLRTAMMLRESCTVKFVNRRKSGEMFVNLFHARRVTVGPTWDTQVSFWVATHEDATDVEGSEKLVANAEQSADKLCSVIEEAVQRLALTEEEEEDSDDAEWSDECTSAPKIEEDIDTRGNTDKDDSASVGTMWKAALVAALAVGLGAHYVKR
jgi:PAS domain S-box-containing protein